MIKTDILVHVTTMTLCTVKTYTCEWKGWNSVTLC